MLLLNRTPLHVATVPNADDNDGIVSLLLVAATFDLSPGVTRSAFAPPPSSPSSSPSPSSPRPSSPSSPRPSAPSSTPEPPREPLRLHRDQKPLLLVVDPPVIGDGYLTKAGTSVCATGFVYAPNGEAPRAESKLFVGDQIITAAAFGPRVWREGPGKTLVPSAPRPFDRVAMSWENAYGGAVLQPTRLQKLPSGEEAILPEHPEAFAENTDGKGYYTDPQGALDAPLPELEDPERLIERWDDRPDPLCFAPYPMYGGLRARFLVHENVVDFTRHPHVLSRAAPRTTFGEIAFGTRVAITGMRPGGKILSFEIPEPPVIAEAKAGKRYRRLTLYVDAIDIDAEEENVRIVYRALFSYPLVRYEQRLVAVRTIDGFEKLLPPL